MEPGNEIELLLSGVIVLVVVLIVVLVVVADGSIPRRRIVGLGWSVKLILTLGTCWALGAMCGRGTIRGALGRRRSGRGCARR